MKTTLELDDSLLREAKGVAAQRGTPLKAIIEHALGRELAPAPEFSNPAPELFEVGPLGFHVLKRKPGDSIAVEQIKAIQTELDDAEFHRAINPRQT